MKENFANPQTVHNIYIINIHKYFLILIFFFFFKDYINILHIFHIYIKRKNCKNFSEYIIKI